MSADGARARGVAAARRILRAIEDDPDPVAAVRAARRYEDDLLELRGEAAALRARLIVAIIDSGRMNRTELAKVLGIHKTRVGQIYKAARG